MTKGIIYLLIFCCCLGCKRNIAESTAGENCEWNATKTTRLCVEEAINPKSNLNTLSYFIYSRNGEVIREGTLNGGRISWLNENAVEIYQPPGMIREGANMNDLISVFVVDTQEMISKSKYLTKSNSKGNP